jgi:hypothetical protein
MPTLQELKGKSAAEIWKFFVPSACNQMQFICKGISKKEKGQNLRDSTKAVIPPSYKKTIQFEQAKGTLTITDIDPTGKNLKDLIDHYQWKVSELKAALANFSESKSTERGLSERGKLLTVYKPTAQNQIVIRLVDAQSVGTKLKLKTCKDLSHHFSSTFSHNQYRELDVKVKMGEYPTTNAAEANAVYITFKSSEELQTFLKGERVDLKTEEFSKVLHLFVPLEQSYIAKKNAPPSILACASVQQDEDHIKIVFSLAEAEAKSLLPQRKKFSPLANLRAVIVTMISNEARKNFQLKTPVTDKENNLIILQAESAEENNALQDFCRRYELTIPSSVRGNKKRRLEEESSSDSDNSPSSSSDSENSASLDERKTAKKMCPAEEKTVPTKFFLTNEPFSKGPPVNCDNFPSDLPPLFEELSDLAQQKF